MLNIPRFTAFLRRAATSLAFATAIVVSGSAVAAPAKFHLEEATLSQIQSAITSKQITTEQLVRLYLSRIKAYNGTCVKMPQGLLGPIETIPHAGQLNALSTLNLRPETRKALGFDERKARSMTDAIDNNPNMPDALEVAKAQDAQFARTGKLVGPLQGMIMAVKDQYDTFDMRTTSGADAFYANDRPPEDSTFVERLRAAGAIILAKANLAEYASGGSRSAFGGVFCNPYDTERSPNNSSAGSGSSVAANLVTCAIAEETTSSVRGPAFANNSVGLAPTVELVSHKGMIDGGLNTRIGPICRNVEDVARVMDVIAGYDPKDPITVFSIGRQPAKPYQSFTHVQDLKGLRIGVVREYMNKKLFAEADIDSIDVVDKALGDLRKLGATLVDPGPEGDLFTSCLKKYEPALENKLFTKKFPEQFPVDKDGKPIGDHVATLVDMTIDPSLVPDKVTLRDFGAAQAVGEGKFQMNLYARRRGDANIKTHADMINKANFYDDPTFPDRKRIRENAEKAMELNMADRLERRFSIQQSMLQCMQEMQLDAITYPTSTLPPAKLGAPAEPTVNGRNGGGVWTFLGQQGFPAITVPAGFTTHVYDRVRDPSIPAPPATDGGGFTDGTLRVGTRLVGPTPAKIPVGIDFMGRPFDEATLFRIASAYARATKHRTPPPDFGPLPNEP